jgi:hypothetical protein
MPVLIARRRSKKQENDGCAEPDHLVSEIVGVPNRFKGFWRT